ISPQLAIESICVVCPWVTLALVSLHFFLGTYLPGYLAGLGLCFLQGRYEHDPATISHYGRIYNFLLFNDGYHAEHHAHPRMDWRALPSHVEAGIRTSAWPAPLRWMDNLSLDGLERMVLRSPRLQRFVLRSHRRAFAALLNQLPHVRSVAI